MQSPRNARRLARWVLGWFALTVSAAIASPLVQTQSFEAICSGMGVMKRMLPSDDGRAPASTPMPACPLCASPVAPPPFCWKTL